MKSLIKKIKEINIKQKKLKEFTKMVKEGGRIGKKT